jgi:glucose-6-phosphate isomerase
VLHLPDNVGGRFSVLSTVGLVPLALCGIDIQALLNGAKTIKQSFFNDGYLKDTLLKKAVFYAKNHAQYNINCIFAYSETLKYFCEWYVQLWGESLGKHQRHSAFHVGLTPIGLIGPKDQHSFLQLIMEGTRDKSVTFIKIEDFDDNISIPDITLPHLEMLDTLNNLPFAQLINMQCDSVMESLEAQKDIPIDSIILPKVNEKTIGSLIYYYELLTSLMGELIDVNTYDQPGVEAGKIILKKKLNTRKN